MPSAPPPRYFSSDVHCYLGGPCPNPYTPGGPQGLKDSLEASVAIWDSAPLHWTPRGLLEPIVRPWPKNNRIPAEATLSLCCCFEVDAALLFFWISGRGR